MGSQSAAGFWAIEGAKATGDVRTPVMLLARQWARIQARVEDARSEWREVVAMAAPGLPIDDASHQRHLQTIRNEMADALAPVDNWPEPLLALLDDWRFEPLWPHLLIRLARHVSHRSAVVERALARCPNRIDVGEGLLVHACADGDLMLLEAGAAILEAAARSAPVAAAAECAGRLLALSAAAEAADVRRRIEEAARGMQSAIRRIERARCALDDPANST